MVDTGSDLTIMGREAFKKVATVAKLRKRDFCPADKKAYNYNGKPFTLEGHLQLEIAFGECTRSTPVYMNWVPSVSTTRHCQLPSQSQGMEATE